MRSTRRWMMGIAASGILTAAAWANPAPKIGRPAPDFTVMDSQGRTQRLSDYKGKYVVLEWFNDKCPFIRKHYDSGNMQRLQERYTGKGVVWFSVLSSAPGTQGYADAAQANEIAKADHSHATALLLDPDGKVGLSYGAKNTPAMYVIAPDGTLIYEGAIDDKPTTDVEDIPGAHNYVAAALDSAMAGKPVVVSRTKAYGCSVKYKG